MPPDAQGSSARSPLRVVLQKEGLRTKRFGGHLIFRQEGFQVPRRFPRLFLIRQNPAISPYDAQNSCSPSSHLVRAMKTFGNASLMDRSGASSLSVSKLEMFLSFETEGAMHVGILSRIRNSDPSHSMPAARSMCIRTCYNPTTRDENTVPVG